MVNAWLRDGGHWSGTLWYPHICQCGVVNIVCVCCLRCVSYLCILVMISCVDIAFLLNFLLLCYIYIDVKSCFF